MRVQPLPKRLMTAAYSASMFIMVGYMMWLYAMGSYRELLIPLFLAMLLLVSLLMHLGQGFRPCIPRILLLASIYIVVLTATYTQPSPAPLWLGLPIAATFLLLPLWSALSLNIVCLSAWWWLAPFETTAFSWSCEVNATARPSHGNMHAVGRYCGPQTQTIATGCLPY